MSLTFPRPMPLAGVGGQRFELQRADFLSPERKGRIGAMAAGFPLWTAEWTLPASMGQTGSDEWRAFLASLEGPLRLFLGKEYGRRFPRAYPAGFDGLSRAAGGAFDGSVTSWSQMITDGQAVLSLGGLPAGLVLAPGDYVDFRWTTGGEARRTLVRSLAPAVASSGGAVSLVVSPAIPALTPESAVAHLDDPACLMRLAPQTEISAMDRRKVAGARVLGVQELLP